MIVIPMAGRSARFQQAGYDRPKYMLPLAGESLFAHTVRSFEALAGREGFVFIHRDEPGVADFIHRELDRLAIPDARLVPLAGDTEGQAHTVYLGTRALADDTPLTIFNIDTIRPGYRPPAWQGDCDGWLEVFSGPGEHWSFAEATPDGRVRRTTEKQRISDLCSDGLYHFARRELFDAGFEAARAAGARARGEYYVAPLYNPLIARGADIRVREIARDEVLFSGTPAEYEALCRDGAALARLGPAAAPREAA